MKLTFCHLRVPQVVRFLIYYMITRIEHIQEDESGVWSEMIVIHWWVLCCMFVNDCLNVKCFPMIVKWIFNGQYVLYRTQPKWMWICNDQMIEYYLCINISHAYCIVLAELGLCPSLLVDSSQKRTQSRGWWPWATVLVYLSMTTKLGGVLASACNAMTEMNDWLNEMITVGVFIFKCFQKLEVIRKR